MLNCPSRLVFFVVTTGQGLLKKRSDPRLRDLWRNEIGQAGDMGQGWAAWSVSSVDRNRALSVVSAAGFVAAAVLALVGLPTIDLHGPLHQWGIMDPFRGGTRAAYYTVHGQWALAWTYNPLGIVAVIAVVAGVARGLVAMISGRWVNVSVAWTPKRRRLVIVALAGFVVVLEARQQSLADLLRQSVDSRPGLLGSP